MIEIKSFTKKYDDLTVYENFSIEIEEGKITAILGASGVGKTTLLNALAGLTDYEGEITGEIAPVSFVFQDDRLLPFATVQKNLEFALGKGDYSQELRSVGLEGCEGKLPGQLSGGMARRVALLRAFLRKSKLLLMDEPFGSLDIGVKYRLMNLFLRLWESDKRTTLLVTHNVDEAMYLSHRVVVIGDKGSILLDKPNDGENLRREIISLFSTEK